MTMTKILQLKLLTSVHVVRYRTSNYSPHWLYTFLLIQKQPYYLKIFFNISSLILYCSAGQGRLRYATDGIRNSLRLPPRCLYATLLAQKLLQYLTGSIQSYCLRMVFNTPFELDKPPLASRFYISSPTFCHASQNDR